MNFINNFKVIGLVACSLIVSTACVAVSGGDTVISGRDRVIGSGNKVTKKVTLNGDFNKVSVPSIVDVVISQGTSNNVNIVGSDNLIKYCKVSLVNNTLNIDLTKEGERVSFSKFDVKVNITAKDINKVDISGTGDVDFKGNFSTSSLGLNISGTGDITVPSLKAENLNVNISGTGDVKIKGNCEQAGLTVSGTGDIDAILNSLSVLKVNVSGTGDIGLSGSADKAQYTVSGTGDIEAKNMTAKSVVATSTGTGDIECYASESFSGTKSTTAGLKCYGNPAHYTLTKN